MLLKKLSDDQKKAFLILSKQCIDADGIVDMNEAQLFSDFKKEMSLENFTFNTDTDHDVDKLISVFTSKKTKHIVLIELLNILLSDNDYSFEERSFISQLSKKMDVHSNDLFLLKSWVEKKIRLDRELNKLINAQG